MMIQNSEYADSVTASMLVDRDYPNSKSKQVIGTGYDNIVILVDKQYAVRFPRNHEALVRDTYESMILEKLTSIRSFSVPKILSTHPRPPYFVMASLRGEQLSSRDIAALPKNEQEAMAQSIGQALSELHTALDTTYVSAIRAKLNISRYEDAWDAHFNKYVKLARFPTKHQTELAQEYYTAWARLNGSLPQVAVHDDLHTENMFFVNHRLAGILDFANTTIGSPEQEMRQLYRISDEFLTLAVRAYESRTGREVDLEASKIWAIIQEISMFAKRLVNGETDHPGFLRACQNLNKWLGGGWGDGIANDRAINSNKQ